VYAHIAPRVIEYKVCACVWTILLLLFFFLNVLNFELNCYSFLFCFVFFFTAICAPGCDEKKGTCMTPGTCQWVTYLYNIILESIYCEPLCIIYIINILYESISLLFVFRRFSVLYTCRIKHVRIYSILVFFFKSVIKSLRLVHGHPYIRRP